MTAGKPYSEACERNRDPVLVQLRTRFADVQSVLEIGSGTGQHAVHFAAALPWLTWQCSDRAEHLPGICTWLEDAQLPNTPAPIELDVALHPWPAFPRKFDAVFSANTLHIMGWTEVEAFFAGIAAVLADNGVLTIYGPFNYGGAYTSESNRQFDTWLATRDARSAIRDFEAVDALAVAAGLRVVDDAEMPANNRCITWRRCEADHRHMGATRT